MEFSEGDVFVVADGFVITGTDDMLTASCVDKTVFELVDIAFDPLGPTGTKRQILSALITGTLNTSPESPLVAFVATLFKFWFGVELIVLKAGIEEVSPLQTGPLATLDTAVASLTHLLGRSSHDMTLGVVFTTLQLSNRCVTSKRLVGMDCWALLVAGLTILETGTLVIGMLNWVKLSPGGGVSGGVSMQPCSE